MSGWRRHQGPSRPGAFPKGRLLLAGALVWGAGLAAVGGAEAFYPHASVNGIACPSCHVPFEGVGSHWLPAWTVHTPVNSDDTQFNSLCWSCHNDVLAPRMETHSSLSTDNRYGNWSMECRTCHWPHHEPQFRDYGSASAIEEGVSTSVDATTLVATGATWTADEFSGRVLLPNQALTYYSYKIISNTADTLTVQGPMVVEQTTAGDPFAIIYGKLIRSEIETPNSGNQETRLFRSVGANSFSDGDGTRDGVCEVCHTMTFAHRNNAGGDHGHGVGGPACTQCHLHSNGFRTHGAHAVHEAASQGPQQSCTTGDLGCHDSAPPPLFADGQNLSNTGACTGCHSANGTAGARAYWTDPGSSRPIAAAGSWGAAEGEQGFCGSCHDATPGVVSGATAPNVMGDNATYGFYTTGHGRASGNYPRLDSQVAAATGNPAANRGCRDCHDSEAQHMGAVDRRLQAGYGNDQANSNCNNCHDPGGSATADPQLYESSADYEATLHGSLLCTQCHDVHGMAGTFVGMAQAASRTLCMGCHATVRIPTAPPAAHDTGATESCATCHNPHKPAHGQGSSGIGCIDCHGHDAGTAYDPDARAPYAAGAQASIGAGTHQSHSTHTETDADDAKGPGLYCDDCHDTANFPYFVSGTDGNADGRYDLSETDVCATCHSAGGSYDGINDPEVGAKSLWGSGAYVATDDSTLAAGREKWCATCHDEAPSVIEGVSAPNVVGDEDGAYTYGSGWGYYKTGHGLPATKTYPASGGITAGGAVECDSCHNLAGAHIDGLVRTYDDGDSGATDAGVYRQGHRLDQVAIGQGTGASMREPLLVPWPANTSNVINNARLCYGCHDSGPYLNGANLNTNLVTGGINRHQYHLTFNSIQYPSDWSGANTSQITCPNCHNVHGSTRLAMVRDGKLTNREPGMRIWYKRTGVTANIGTANPPVPEDLPLAASDGTVWINNTVHNLCIGCHNTGILEGRDRTPMQDTTQAPTLAWTGEAGYTADGAAPDAGLSGSTFTFRVEYTDTNNDPPSAIQVWIDANDNGSYEVGAERHTMTGADLGDSNYMNGKIYKYSLSLGRAGDNVIRYRFYASDGTDPAVGPPTTGGTVRIFDNAPSLAWTGENYYVADGVNPEVGGDGASYMFRVDYTDIDNDPPTSIQVWVDEDDSGTYAAGERYNLTAVDGDAVYSDGKRYARSLTLARTGDGILQYRFYASDGPAMAAGDPTVSRTLTVLAGSNGPPSLDWEAAACRSEGVKPARGAAGATFEFQVKYTDPDDTPPSSIQVWVDLNDNATYEGGEQYNLTALDGGDIVYSDGKLYGTSMPLGLAGDNLLNYRYVASDGTDSALGTPTGDHSLEVVNAVAVRTGSGDSGPLWYNSIQAAIDASRSGTRRVLVYEGVYSGSLSLWEVSYSNSVVNAVCGSEVTTITGAGNVIFLQNVSGVVIDGFEITGGTTGVNSNGGSATLANCKIHGNNNGGGRAGGLNAGNASGIFTVVDSEIYENTATEGAGVTLNAGFGHSFTRTVIRDNTATVSNAGGVFTQNGSVTFTDCDLRDNTATTTGGAVLSNGSDTTFTRCTITGNTAAGGIGGALNNGNSACDAVFENCIVSGNRGTQAGAVYVNQGTLNVVNSTFADNQATAGSGGAISSNGGTNVVCNSIFWNNTASADGYIAYQNGGTMTITDSVLASGGDGIFTNTPYFSGSGTATVSGYASDSDPHFVHPAGGDYHLLVPSVAIDNTDATYAPATDIDGESRPQGVAYDIGADEYATADNGPVLSWTGEAGYTTDAVDPDSGVSGSLFTFRVEYLDADNDAPRVIETWVDTDADGAFSADEKRAMAEVDGADTTFSDGKLYAANVAVSSLGTIPYRMYATDGSYDATGSPTTGGSLTVLNNPPTLAWTGDANYVGDGVNPDSAIGGTGFQFRVDFTDVEGSLPSSIQVWVDVDDNGSYAPGERYDLSATDVGDTDTTDGKRYARTLTLGHAGDGNIYYRFYASDGRDLATGSPTAARAVTVINNVPTLSWTGEAGYVADGVNPDTAPDGSNFTFRVDYTDIDDRLPTTIQVWVDEDDSGTYEVGERYTLTATDAGDTSSADGKRYARSLTLANAGDGFLNYRFYATDSSDPATGSPAANRTVEVTIATNNAPVLSWTGETGYTADGVDPDSGPGGGSFVFRVRYTDADNQAPSSIQVWIDGDDSASYEPGEQFAMTEVDADDTTTTDGKLYTVTRPVPEVLDEGVNYRFYASDSLAGASGIPTGDSSVTVVSPITVCASGCDFTTIQAAINFSASGDYIRVSDGTYSEAVNFSGKNVMVFSINGAASTRIQGTTGDSPVLTFSSGETSSAVLQGFTIDHQASGGGNQRGIAISNNSAPTIRDCVVRYNTPASYVDGANIYINGGGITLDGATVGGVSGTPSTGDLGTAIYATNTTPQQPIVIVDSDLSYNSGNSAAIHLISRTATTTITNSTITYNTSSQYGAGIRCESSPLVIAGSTIDRNTGGANTWGGALYLSGASTTLTITGPSSISNNSVRDGAGIWATGIGAVSISDTTLNSNTATGYGGAIGFSNVAGNISLTRLVITNNTSTANGAGIYLTSTTAFAFDLTDCNVDNNTVTNTGSYDGGGLYLNAALVTASISGGSISGNTGRNGGGIWAAGGLDLSIGGVTISGNNAISGAGGGLYLSGAGTLVDVNRSWIRGNRALTYGGGIQNASSATTTLTNSMVTGNLIEGVSYNDGCGVYNGATMVAMNSTIVGNRAARNGGGWNGSGTITNCIFWGNSAGGSGQQIQGSPTVTYSDVAGGFTGTGNVDLDPTFVNLQIATAGNQTTAGNFHLQSGSQVANRGMATGAPADDFDGDVRPLGAGIDMGADEVE